VCRIFNKFSLSSLVSSFTGSASLAVAFALSLAAALAPAPVHRVLASRRAPTTRVPTTSCRRALHVVIRARCAPAMRRPSAHRVANAGDVVVNRNIVRTRARERRGRRARREVRRRARPSDAESSRSFGARCVRERVCADSNASTNAGDAPAARQSGARAMPRGDAMPRATTSGGADGEAAPRARGRRTREHAVPPSVEKLAASTFAAESKRNAREMEEAWKSVVAARTRGAIDDATRSYHALARAIEREERGFEDFSGSCSSALRREYAGLKAIDDMPFKPEWRRSIVDIAVGEQMYVSALCEQAGAMRVMRACGLGCRMRNAQKCSILPFDDATKDLYCNVLSEIAFEGRSYVQAMEARRDNEHLLGPTAELDMRRLKTYAMGALCSLLVTDTAASDNIRNGVMESLLIPLVRLICRGGEDMPAWEISCEDTLRLAEDAGEGCSSGLDAGDHDDLHRSLMQARLTCVGAIGDYVECFAEALKHGVLELSLRLVAGPRENGWLEKYGFKRHHGETSAWPGDPQLSEALSVVSAFLAHRKFAISFIDAGGAKLLLNIPRGPMTYYNLTRCLFGIASITTALERLVSPQVDLARRYVKVSLELLDCSNEYARRQAALFLTFAMQIPVVVVAFDAEAGLKLVLDVLRTLAVMVVDVDKVRPSMSPNEISQAKETGDHVSLLLRQYMRAHFAQHVKAIEEKVMGKSKKSTSTNNRAMLQAMDIGYDATERLFSLVSRQKRIAAVMQTKSWLVIEAFVAQKGPKVMLDLLTLAPGEKTLRECVLGSLSVLKIVTSHPTGRVHTAKAQFDEYYSSGYVLIDVVENAAEAVDTEAVVEALKVVCNLVSPPYALHSTDAKSQSGKLQRSHSIDGKSFSVFDYARMEETFEAGRKHIREAFGVKSLLNLLFKTSKTLPQPSMNISRALCCRALLGLSRDASIANTLQTLQIARHLSELLRETGTTQHSAFDELAIVDSKRENGTAATVQAAATEFHRCAVELIAATAGFANVKATTPAVASDAAAPPLAKLERHLIAAATKVRYPHNELLQIMHEHLVAAGLTSTAASLVDEAGMERPGRSASVGRLCPSPAPRLKLNFKSKTARTKMYRRAPRSRMTGAARGMLGIAGEPFTLGLEQGSTQAPPRKGPRRGESSRASKLSPAVVTTSVNSVKTSKPGANGIVVTPCSTRRGKKRKTNGEEIRKSLITPPIAVGATERACCANEHQTPSPSVKERVHKEFPTPGVLVSDAPRGETGCGVRSRLDSILTQYLRAQHRQCAAPITACAPFSLLAPHQCPQPKRILEAPRNLTARLRQREWANVTGWDAGMRRADRHFVYSRFRPLRAIRGNDCLFTAASFLYGVPEQIIIGDNDGELHLYDHISGELLEIAATPGRVSGAIRKIAAAGPLCPTPLFAVTSVESCSIWSLPNPDDAPYMLWCSGHSGCAINSTGSQFVSGSLESVVELADMETHRVTRRLTSNTGGPPLLTKNNDEVSFSPSDDLILWDEVLWDVRLANDKPIRRFDRYSEAAGACFHPGGNEIIIGREVWDIRSSRLLRVVPSLDRAALKFNLTGTVGMAHILHPRNEPPLSSLRKCHHPYKHSFCTIDMLDYSDICTVDVPSGMIDAAWDVNSDTLCATVEYDILNTHESTVRLHEVGRLRPADDESDVEDEHEEIEPMVLNMDHDGWEEDYSDEDSEERIEDADGRVNINEARIRHQINSLREMVREAEVDWVRYDDDGEGVHSGDDDSSEYDSDFIDSDSDDAEDDLHFGRALLRRALHGRRPAVTRYDDDDDEDEYETDDDDEYETDDGDDEESEYETDDG